LLGKTCTKSAFCQARLKLAPKLFEDMLALTAKSFYAHAAPRRLKGYLLRACDCTVQMLPDNEETRKIGVHKNQYGEVASVKISACLDLLNGIIVSATLHQKSKTDLVCVLEGQAQAAPNDSITVYDRGYDAQVLAFIHGMQGSKYVIRRTLDSNAVKALLQSPENEAYITEPLTQKCYWRLEEMGIRKSQHDTISYRMVKVALPTGETEVLMTGLGPEFTADDIAEIYRLRWGIETCFGCIKNWQMLGIFSGYSQQAVKQDIWCNLIFYNLQTITMMEAERQAKAISEERAKKPSKRRKRQNQGYKVNRNVGCNTLRSALPALLSCPRKQLDALLDALTRRYLTSLEMVKPNTRERRKKMIRNNDRHQTEMNYKRGF
jgi:hypothetical protein